MNDRPTVQHFLLCRAAKVRPPARPFNPYTLRGVTYQYLVPARFGLSPADPKPAKVLRLFTRFFGGEGAHDFELEFGWADAPDGERLTETYGPYTITFRAGDGVRDFVFAVRNVPLWGVGRYEVLLRAVDDADGEPLAREYFEVMQS
jgi:hypothetical protein